MQRLTIDSGVATVVDKPAVLHRALKDTLRGEIPRLILRVHEDPPVALERTTLSRCLLWIGMPLKVLGSVEWSVC